MNTMNLNPIAAGIVAFDFYQNWVRDPYDKGEAQPDLNLVLWHDLERSEKEKWTTLGATIQTINLSDDPDAALASFRAQCVALSAGSGPPGFKWEQLGKYERRAWKRVRETVEAVTKAAGIYTH